MARRDKQEQQQAELESAAQYVNEYYQWDTTQKADVASLRKSRKFMAIGIVSIFVVILIGLGCYVFSTQQALARRNTCWAYEQQVEQWAANYVNQNGLASYPAYLEDIDGSDEMLKGKCPDGGEYTWNPVTGEYACSEDGHYPDGWNSPKSKSTGSTQTVTGNNSNS